MNLREQIQQAREEVEELESQLQDPSVFSDPQKAQEVNEKYARFKKILKIGERYEKGLDSLEEAEEIIAESEDGEMIELAKTDKEKWSKLVPKLEKKLTKALIPPDPLDTKNILIEIRAGTGGDEAALFAGELFRMYTRYAEEQGWTTKMISSGKSDLGGFKEAVFSIKGTRVYSKMKFEAGVHRVQRVPDTEKSGRVHTSTSTVAVLPEAEEVDVQIEPNDLKVETSTSQGAGGQSVNNTYSAIRITHIPTGIVAQCQDEKSQHKNRDKAMEVIRARVFAHKQKQVQEKREAARRGQIGTGERSEKIRTYNFPQDRVTDHRIQQNFHNIDAIMDGEIEDIIKGLRKLETQQKLDALTHDSNNGTQTDEA